MAKAKAVFSSDAKVERVRSILLKTFPTNKIFIEYPRNVNVKVVKNGMTYKLWFGDANELIGCDVNVVTGDGPTGENLDTTCPIDCGDPAVVADAIIDAVRRFESDTPIQTFAACFTAVEQQLLVGLLQVERDASLENDRDAAHVTLVENVVAKLGGTLEKY